MPSLENDNRQVTPDAGGGAPGSPEPNYNGAWPVPEPELAEVVQQLMRYQPRVEPARPEFEQAQRALFVRRAETRLADDRSAAPQASPRRAGALHERPSPHTVLRATLGRWSLPLAAGAALAIVVLVAFVLPRLPGGGPTPPPPIDRADLVAKNAQAWADLQTLSGAFSTGDGWYYEEWISRQADGGLRYKRFIRPPDRTPNRPQWNVSDGRTEWVVDAATRQVRFSRPAVPGDFTAVAPNDAMQCTALALPPTMVAGTAPIPVLVNDRPAYRLDGTLPDGSPGTFWIDARDYLVFRIDRPGRGTVWERGKLDLNPPLPAEVFRPNSLTNL